MEGAVTTDSKRVITTPTYYKKCDTEEAMFKTLQENFTKNNRQTLLSQLSLLLFLSIGIVSNCLAMPPLDINSTRATPDYTQAEA